MARLQVIQLMISVFTLSFQITSVDMVSVHPGENITLSCNITNDSDISWYRLQSDELKLITSARNTKLKSGFSPSYNIDESHFDVTENRSLVIKGVKEEDLGSYYCGGQNTTRILFGKPITLKFTDDPNEESVQVSSADPKLHRCQILNLILTCVCSVSVLINIICICVFSFQVKGSSLTCCSSDSNTINTDEKEINLHYASFTHQRDSTSRNPSDSDRVTYAGIRPLPS